MKTPPARVAAALLVSSLACLAASPSRAAESVAVTLDAVVHGAYQINPSLPADGKFAAGTVVAPKTRAAVEEVISRLGYEPMHAARKLMRKRRAAPKFSHPPRGA